tara:strand:+ start:147 stop:389 length:243 start_codon:yes stop_codon:yes gene_type:complete
VQRKQQHNLNLDGLVGVICFWKNFVSATSKTFFNIQKKKPKTLLSPTTSTKPAPKHLPGQTNAYIKEATAVPPQTYTNSA